METAKAAALANLTSSAGPRRGGSFLRGQARGFLPLRGRLKKDILMLVLSMNVKFEKKPSKEIIEKFCKKIEKFLSSQELRIRVELLDTPMPLESYVNGKHTNTTYLWIDKCLINTPKTKKEIEVRLFGDGVDDTTSDEQIWNEEIGRASCRE